ncbi:MAG: hypothetical protein AAB516_01145 [Patescibacteria group bacterium]
MSNIIFSLVKSEKELNRALNLAYLEYRRKKFIKASNEKIYKTSFNTPSKSVTFVAKNNNKVIATASLIIDSESGLPMDSLYKKELDDLRKKGKKISEISQLAFDNETTKSSFEEIKTINLLLTLFKLMFHYCLYRGINNICICVNPLHKIFYEHLFFKDLGKGLKKYPAMNGAPAIAKYLTINKQLKKIAAEKKPAVYKIFYKNKPNYKMFGGKSRLTFKIKI